MGRPKAKVLSPVLAKCLAATFQLQNDSPCVKKTAIAERLGVSLPNIYPMIRELKKRDCIADDSDGIVVLSHKGMVIAERMVRMNDTLDILFCELLEMPAEDIMHPDEKLNKYAQGDQYRKLYRLAQQLVVVKKHGKRGVPKLLRMLGR